MPWSKLCSKKTGIRISSFLYYFPFIICSFFTNYWYNFTKDSIILFDRPIILHSIKSPFKNIDLTLASFQFCGIFHVSKNTENLC